MAFRIILWVVSGLFFFCLVPVIGSSQARFYAQNEPYFKAPVPSSSGTLRLRSDVYGKGYFGASRNGGRLHKGIDFMTPVGKPVLAAKSGRVSVSGVDKGYGNYIEIRHPDGTMSRYAHLSVLSVREADWIAQNQIIGYSGKTGNANHPKMVPHLHFEIRYNNQALNPTRGLLDPRLRIR